MDINQVIRDHADWLVDHHGKRANLTGANLTEANLTGANLSWANLTGANLTEANLTGANLTGADLTGVILTGANLTGADLTKANLTGANLTKANLTGANLTGAKGLIRSADWLKANFKTDALGILVYKAFGDTYFSMPDNWVIEPNNFIEETVNPNRTTNCGCGVNFATLQWIRDEFHDARVFKCRVHWIDLADTVVPYNTDGKARCARLELLEEVSL